MNLMQNYILNIPSNKFKLSYIVMLIKTTFYINNYMINIYNVGM